MTPSLSLSEGEGWGGVLFMVAHVESKGTPPLPSPSPSVKGRETRSQIPSTTQGVTECNS